MRGQVDGLGGDGLTDLGRPEDVGKVGQQGEQASHGTAVTAECLERAESPPFVGRIRHEATDSSVQTRWLARERFHETANDEGNWE